jgi:hypothetical protein
MHVSYDDIEFKILTITEAVREQVYDPSEVDLLYDHFGMRCTAWLNPKATNAKDFPGVEGREKYTKETSPAITEIELVYRLAQPRKKLKIWMDSKLDLADKDPKEYILESPYKDMDTDAKFGPACRLHRFIPDHGNASLVVDLEFHTTMSPCKDTDASAIVSNRWTYKITYNPENYAEIRIIEGTAFFRMDLLLKQFGGVADNARQFLVPPPLNGYQRHAPIFELSPGGDALKYLIIDEQKPMSFPLGNKYRAASIQVKERRQYTTVGGSLTEPQLGRAPELKPLGPPGQTPKMRSIDPNDWGQEIREEFRRRGWQ